MARLVVKNEHEHDTRYNGIRLCPHDIDTILGVIVNTCNGAYKIN